MIRYFGIIVILFALTSTACRTASDGSETKTDLGPAGNKKVVEQFKLYQNKSEHCDGTGTGTRILMTGFGLFSSPPKNARGTPYNISGLVARFMADDQAFPSIVDTAKTQPLHTIAQKEYATHSHMPANAQGAVIKQREMVIDTIPVTVCFVMLDVIWDQAAAIILFESTTFKPDRIIMSGLNSGEKKFGMFEAGAVNNATAFGGFDAEGKPIDINVPVQNLSGGSPVLPPGDAGVQETIAMTWNGKNLASTTEPLAKNIKRGLTSGIFSVRSEAAERRSNDYICNNVSFVILHGIKGAVVNLAGGLLRLGPADRAPTAGQQIEFVEFSPTIGAAVKSAGFFHYPNTATDKGATIFGWGKVMAKAMITGI